MKYTCTICKGEFEPDWSNEKALAELKHDFGDVPLDQCDTVCDVCYQEISPRNNPDYYAEYLAAATEKPIRFNTPLPTQTMLDDTEVLRRVIEEEITQKLAEWIDNEIAREVINGSKEQQCESKN